MTDTYTCPTCKREFPVRYWGVRGRTSDLGTREMTGLARANFERHKRACKSKGGSE